MGRDADIQDPPASVGRDADIQKVPASMRRDVRLLGDILGQVIAESGGQGLLDDVERLRHAVIAARRGGSSPAAVDEAAAERADDDIAALVASWPLDRADAVARAFTVYFHLANLAEEHLPHPDAARARHRRRADARVAGRGRPGTARTARPGRVRPAAGRPAGAPGADRAPDRGPAPGGDRVAAADRRAARRPGRGPARRQRPGRGRPRGCARRSTCCGGPPPCASRRCSRWTRSAPARRRSTRRCSGWSPSCTGRSTGRCRATESGQGPPLAPAFLRYGSWIGADRDGNPYVTAQVTLQAARDPGRPRAARAGERRDPDRPGADRARARACPPIPNWALPWPPPAGAIRSSWPSSRRARRRSRTGSSCCSRRGGCGPPGWPAAWPRPVSRGLPQRRRVHRRPAGCCSGRWPRRARAARPTASCSG